MVYHTPWLVSSHGKGHLSCTGILSFDARARRAHAWVNNGVVISRERW
ncbi:MAG: hypothetical protein GYA24_07640 [Candidatus Lokiarchaeota archaeon]|nr:hypothetical protein [Candidatus Lokiarchaeota archaeon]